MIPRPHRSASLDFSRISETQRSSLPNTFHLASYQTSLRLRHLTQIVGSNLIVSKDVIPSPIPNALPAFKPRVKPNTGFYFTLESSSKVLPLYTSECHHSNCPIWDPFDCSTIFPIHLLSLKGIVIRVWFKAENEKSHHICSWGVHFSGLVPLPTSTIHLNQYPSNTLILKVRGYYYTSYDCVENVKFANEESYLFSIQKGFAIPLSETKPSYSVASLCRLHSTKRAIRQQEQKIERFEGQLEYKGIKKNSEKMILHNKVENMHVKTALLKEQLMTEVHYFKSIQTAADRLDLANQDKGIELLESFQLLNRQLAILRNKEEKLIQDNTLLKEILNKVKDRRVQLLSQIPLVFPVEQIMDDVKNYTICNVHLPDAENYSGTSEQTLSVALGFVAQLLVKIAYIINIPLKYPITLRGSLSSVADLTSTQLQDVETQFPLFTRGKEKERLHFNYAVFLLNKNIAQLRWSCGLPTPDLRTTLVNIFSLLRAFQNAGLNACRAFMPDTVLLQPILPASLRQNLMTQSTLQSSFKYSLSIQQTPASPKFSKCTVYSDSDVGELSSFIDGNSSKLADDLSGTESDDEIDKANSFERTIKFPSLSNHSKSVSCSLDKGLNCLSESRSGVLLDLNEPSLIKTKSFITATSGSYPDLTISEAKNISNGDASGEFTELHKQTTELLQSWHEDNPTPYASITTVSSSIEKLDDAQSSMSSPEVMKKVLDSNKITLQDSYNDNMHVPICCLEEEVPEALISKLDNKSCTNLEVSKSNPDENVESTLVKEIGATLSDYGISEESFLTDVASRTANLASQNCSFKMCHSRQPTKEE